MRSKVSRLSVFGSILTDRFNEDSDVDMVVDFDKVTLKDYADNYFDLKFSLEDILSRVSLFCYKSKWRLGFLHSSTDFRQFLSTRVSCLSEMINIIDISDVKKKFVSLL